MNNIEGLYRRPFSTEPPKRLAFAPGLTLADMAAMADLPSDFGETGTICVGGRVMPRDMWSTATPKSGHVVTFHHMPLHGGGGGRKAVLGIIVAIATVLTAGLALQYGIPALGIAGGTWQAALVGSCFSPTGSCALEAMQ
ncbi:MAG: hypothetical protein JNK47_16835 [Mesorhizobium sp.]|nr:hypothetical protein [Mesorhizobium sp.]MBL8578891.1 hypothetical protein [Mesorhizobium sp.]